jgi:anti-sigma regulatory factor (Ser/Thr protein kinase)
MTEQATKNSGAQSLRPRARILRTLGDELISSETVALIELVKNAFDADATRVLVRFHAPLEIGAGKIEIIDNGHGMDLKTIQTAWLEPATLSKKRRTRSESGLRRVLGEKGIGRFAASRLADHLEVVTRRTKNDNEVRVFFDWSQFDDEKKYLDEVKVLWEETKPTEICPSGTIRALYDEKETHIEDGRITHDLGRRARCKRRRAGCKTPH